MSELIGNPKPLDRLSIKAYRLRQRSLRVHQERETLEETWGCRKNRPLRAVRDWRADLRDFWRSVRRWVVSCVLGKV
jgi:hypothetical protein